MEPQSVRKTYKYRLSPTPEQEQALDTVLWRCRTLYNVALDERKTAWERCGVSLNYYHQANELPDLKAACSEYGEVHSQILQDVLRRLERTFQAFFRRIQRGEKAGFPRFKGCSRYRSFTYAQYGNGAVVDGGVLSLSKIGRIAIRLHRPIEGTPKTVTIRREADGWYVCFACADVPIQPLPATGQETGIDMGLESFATLANGQPIFQSQLLSQGRSVSAPLPTARCTPQEGESPPSEGGEGARQGASTHRQPAARVPSPASGEAGARLRQHRL
jgi:putative transposase